MRLSRGPPRRSRTAKAGLTLFVAYLVYMASAGGDPPSAFPAWRQFIHVAPAWLLVAMTGLPPSSVTAGGDRSLPPSGWRSWRTLACCWCRKAAVRDRAPPPTTAWLASIAGPTTTISSSYGGAIPFIVDAVHIDAFGLNTPYIARHGTFDPDGPQDSKTDMRWVIEQRPDIVEGYLSGLALLRGAGTDEILGVRRRKMILEMVSSPRFQREYVFVRNAPYDRMDRAVFLRRDFWEAHPARHTRLRAGCRHVARGVRWAVTRRERRDTLTPVNTFVTSASVAGPRDGVLRDDIPQFAFVGRSNVGKSSLLNALMRQKLARTSAAAGKTRQTNIYQITVAAGLGHAGGLERLPRRSAGLRLRARRAESITEMAAVVEAYFAAGRRPSPERAASAKPRRGGIFLLVDSRHPGLAADDEAYKWIVTNVAVPHVIATKVDKLSRAERTRNLRAIADAFGQTPLAVSSDTGEGLDDLRRVMANLAKVGEQA